LTELVVNNSIVVFDFSFDIDSILIPWNACGNNDSCILEVD
jgi:hypothetical protein